MRSFFRHIILDILSFCYALVGFRQKGFVQFVYFHDVLPTELDRFEKLIISLKKEFTFVSHSKAIGFVQSKLQLQRNHMSISFDDGFKNNLAVARLLHKHGISACFFVCPSFVEQSFVPNKIEVLRTVFDERQDKEFMNWSDLKELIALGHEIGNHTLSHVRLSDCDDETIQNELTHSQELFVQNGLQVEHFAFPYGRKQDYKFSIDKYIRSFNFNSIANAERGLHFREGNDFIFRDHILISWPKRHILFFLKRNQYNRTFQNVQWKNAG